MGWTPLVPEIELPSTTMVGQECSCSHEKFLNFKASCTRILDRRKLRTMSVPVQKHLKFTMDTQTAFKDWVATIVPVKP